MDGCFGMYIGGKRKVLNVYSCMLFHDHGNHKSMEFISVRCMESYGLDVLRIYNHHSGHESV